MKTTAAYKTDFSDLPPLTNVQEAELKSVANLSDDEIDTSDIPPLSEAFWENAERGKFCKSVK